jgi:hypothetical protein
MFWRNVLAIITANMGLLLIILAINYLPLGLGFLAFLYGIVIILLSSIEIAGNINEWK